jgi:hypothetical protein
MEVVFVRANEGYDNLLDLKTLLFVIPLLVVTTLLVNVGR